MNFKLFIKIIIKNVKNNILVILLICIWFLTFNNLIFTESNNDLNIINIPIGASISLGNEFAVVDNGVFNLLTNPAMLGKARTINSIEYNRLFYYADTYYDLIGLSGANISQGFVSGIVLGRFSSGNVAIRDMEGVFTGQNVEYAITNVNVGLASRVGKYLWLGVSGYGLWEKSNTDSRFFGSNLGLIYNFNIKNNFFKYIRLGATIRGLGVNKNLVHNEAILIKLYDGIMYYNLYFGKESSTVNASNNDKYNLGISLDVFRNNISLLNLKGGVSGFNNDLLKSYTGGFELKYKDFIIDYSASMHNYLKMVYSIKIGYFFGEPSELDYIAAARRKEQKLLKEEKERIISVAVVDFKEKDLNKEDVIKISDLFREELSKVKKYKVLDKKAMNIILKERRLDSLDVVDKRTGIEVGKQLFVEQIIFGVVAKVKEFYYLTINFMEVNTGIILKTESVRMQDLSEFSKICKDLVKKFSEE